MLLTRSPLSPAPKGRFSLDLHVLSAPPAFVLSQDQTLREELSASKKEASFRHLELVLKVSPEGDDRFVRFLAGSHKPPPRSRRKRTLLSFQRPRRLEVRPVKKPPTRARGLQITRTCVVSECVRRRSDCRVAGTFLRAACWQPGNDSSDRPPVKRPETA